MELNRHWWKECVFYQIYPRSFQDSNGDGMGDLRGIINRVDHLVELGIGAIWLGPVFKSPNDDMGYDIADYRDIMEQFGTMADWEELRDKLQAELDNIIAAECPLCGSVMIQSINKPFISKEEEAEASLWSI